MSFFYVCVSGAQCIVGVCGKDARKKGDRNEQVDWSTDRVTSPSKELIDSSTHIATEHQHALETGVPPLHIHN